MSFSYKDLTYIRAAIQAYEASLSSVSEDECSSADEFSEMQDDILYLDRLLALVNREIAGFEDGGPSLNPVRDSE